MVNENLENLAKQYPELSHATLDKSNFTYTGKTFTKEQSDELGKIWVGPNYTVTSQGGFISEDGTRRYRPAENKKNSPYAKTGSQANYERFIMGVDEKGKNILIRESNLHLNIKE